MVNNYKTEGIIIKRTNLGEADRLLTIMTPFSGKIRAIAKGARKITSRRAPSLELFNQASFVVHKSTKYEYIAEARTIHAFEGIRSNLDHVRTAYQLVELVHVLTREDQEADGVYELLTASLHRLHNGMHFNSTEFKHRLLSLLGFLSEDSREEYEIDSYIEEIAQRRLFTKRIYE